MNLQYTVSIKKDTNKLISSSKDKFLGINNGALIKLNNDPVLYTVVNREPLFYINDFNIQNSKILIIDEDISINLQKEDIIKITYKEYEAKFISNIINKGIKYIPEEYISISGGTLSMDIFINNVEPTLLKILNVNHDFGIEGLEIINKGKYIIPPENPIKVISKNGEGLLIDIKYMEISNRSSLERTIKDIYVSDNKTYIVLDYSIPSNITNGKLSCEKNILTLSSNYIGETIKNLEYQIFTHFTPNISIPLLLKNSISTEVVFNKACLILDEEIGKIKKHLNLN